MIMAWILYYDETKGKFLFEERQGSSYSSTKPEDWGLEEEDTIILVLQGANFLQAWVEGQDVRKW